MLQCTQIGQAQHSFYMVIASKDDLAVCMRIWKSSHWRGSLKETQSVMLWWWVSAQPYGNVTGVGHYSFIHCQAAYWTLWGHRTKIDSADGWVENYPVNGLTQWRSIQKLVDCRSSTAANTQIGRPLLRIIREGWLFQTKAHRECYCFLISLPSVTLQ